MNLQIKKLLAKPDNLSNQPVVGLILLNTSDNRILYLQDTKSGLFGIPTGRVEKNETKEEALVREVDEEINLKLSLLNSNVIGADYLTTLYPISHLNKGCRFELHVYLKRYSTNEEFKSFNLLNKEPNCCKGFYFLNFNEVKELFEEHKLRRSSEAIFMTRNYISVS